MRKLLYFSLLLLLSGWGCHHDGDDDTMPPSASMLIFPAQNAACTAGTVVTDSTASIVFTWQAANNTDSYVITIKDLLTQTLSRQTINTNQATVTLKRNNPYSWFVTSKSASTPDTAKSDTWKFYMAGPGSVYYAPFPAALTAPLYGAQVSGATVDLTWEGSDADSDITGYDVYLGTSTAPALLQSDVANPLLNGVAVTANTTYYWKVVTHDAQGNSAVSELGVFKVN